METVARYSSELLRTAILFWVLKAMVRGNDRDGLATLHLPSVHLTRTVFTFGSGSVSISREGGSMSSASLEMKMDDLPAGKSIDCPSVVPWAVLFSVTQNLTFRYFASLRVPFGGKERASFGSLTGSRLA